jgi:hypothetical protein
MWRERNRTRALASAVLLLAAALASCGGGKGEVALCSTGLATMDCAGTAGTWSGTWREEVGTHAGELGGSWRFSIAADGCTVAGTADFASVPVELAGIVCNSVEAHMRVRAGGAAGWAKVRFTSATETTGVYTISVDAAVDAGEPGTSQGRMTGAKE